MVGPTTASVRISCSTQASLVLGYAHLGLDILGVTLYGLEVAFSRAVEVSVDQLPAGRVVVPRLCIVDAVGRKTEESSLRNGRAHTAHRQHVVNKGTDAR